MTMDFYYQLIHIPQFGWPLNDWIIKIDINGNVLWDKQFGNGIYSNGVTDSKITIDNGIILAGSTSKYSGNYDPTFIKIRRMRRD